MNHPCLTTGPCNCDGSCLRKTRGQVAYEADVQAKPLYHDGTPRKTWEQLGEGERRTWERNPTPHHKNESEGRE